MTTGSGLGDRGDGMVVRMMYDDDDLSYVVSVPYDGWDLGSDDLTPRLVSRLEVFESV